MKYCPECGTAIQIPNAKFCTECGTSFGVAQNIISEQASAIGPKNSLESHQLAIGKADEIQIESPEFGDDSLYIYTANRNS